MRGKGLLRIDFLLSVKGIHNNSVVWTVLWALALALHLALAVSEYVTAAP